MRDYDSDNCNVKEEYKCYFILRNPAETCLFGK